MMWSRVGKSLRLCFFLRVPLFTLLVVAVLGPVSQFTSARALLGNLFDQQNDAGAIWYDVFAVSFAAFLLVFTALTALNLTLHYGTSRFSDESVSLSVESIQAPRHLGLTFCLGTLAALNLVGTVLVRTGLRYWVTSVSAALLAFASALAMALLAKIVQLALTDARITKRPPPLLIFPVHRLPWLAKLFDKLYCWPPEAAQSMPANAVRWLKGRLSELSQQPFQTIGPAGQGYLMLVQTPDGPRLKLRSGHVFALTLALLALATYIVVGLNKASITATPASVPALAYVLLFLIVACWFLSALAFFLDRYRVPLFAGVILLASLTALSPQSDHFFRVETGDSVSKLKRMNAEMVATPAEYLSTRARDPHHRRLILIATPGGGIQAAAWTAEVLQQLDSRFPDHNGANGFRDSVALISSVSGGSLGAVIYAASFAGNVDPGCVAMNARASAIDEVAWGWSSPDFWRAVLPPLRARLEIDRGWALEQKWAVLNGLSPEPYCAVCRTRTKLACVGTNLATSPDPAGNDTYLSDWAAKGTQLPALIFNSMLLERGQHVVFSTTRFPAKADPRGVVNFYDLYPDIHKPFDVRVNTAARLSASFPYVAPAARPNLRAPSVGDFHFVDGGYYDNLGIDALIGWLSSAYEGNPSLREEVPEVLILQIRHFNPEAQATGLSAGWGFQLVAPLVALLDVWNNSPVHRDQNELDLYVRNALLSKQGPAIRTVTIPYCGLDYGKHSDTASAFEACIASAGGRPLKGKRQPVVNTMARSASKQQKIDCAEPPLSWKLTSDQKVCIDETWNLFAQDDPNGALQSIEEFLYANPTSALSPNE